MVCRPTRGALAASGVSSARGSSSPGGHPAIDVVGLEDGVGARGSLTTRYYDGSIAAQQSVTVKGYSKRCE